MRKPFVLAVLATTVLTFASLAPVGPSATARAAHAQGRRDTTWYHASDVARLAKTGRPQLLEFFHPN